MGLSLFIFVLLNFVCFAWYSLHVSVGPLLFLPAVLNTVGWFKTFFFFIIFCVVCESAGFARR